MTTRDRGLLLRHARRALPGTRHAQPGVGHLPHRRARWPSGCRSLRLWFPDGLRDFVPLLDAGDGAARTDVFAFAHEVPGVAGTVEVALRSRSTAGERFRGFADNRATSCGGTHVVGFRAGLAAAVGAYAGRRCLPARQEPDLTGSAPPA